MGAYACSNVMGTKLDGPTDSGCPTMGAGEYPGPESGIEQVESTDSEGVEIVVYPDDNPGDAGDSERNCSAPASNSEGSAISSGLFRFKVVNEGDSSIRRRKSTRSVRTGLGDLFSSKEGGYQFGAVFD